MCGLCLALYGRELEEDEEEEEEEEDEQLEVHRLPDLLFRTAPQLLQYTAALHSHYGSEDDNAGDDGDAEGDLEVQRERRGELRLESNIGTCRSTREKFIVLCCLSIKPSGRMNLLLFSVCLDGSFGDDCSVSCEDCVNGACSEDRDRCECSPGWTGITCNGSKCDRLDILQLHLCIHAFYLQHLKVLISLA